MQVSSLYWAASFIAIACSSPALAGEDVGAGHETYQTQCSPCHSNQPGVNGIGPSLAGLAGRKAGSLPGFHFTPALQGSGLTWNADTFIQFLGDPSKLVPGTAMTVTVPDATARANLFAYLATLKDTTAAAKPSVAAAPKITGPTKAELEEAASSTDGRVSSTSRKSRRRTRRACDQSASIARSRRHRCRRVRSFIRA
jgi:cytochrome c